MKRDSWDAYWLGASGASTLSSEGVNHPLITGFWKERLGAHPFSGDNTTVLDVASGNGVLLSLIKETSWGKRSILLGVDISIAATEALISGPHDAMAVVADAAALPFLPGTVSLIVSQYGVEYAGSNAILELVQLASDSATIILLMHKLEGEIYLECKANFEAVTQLISIEFIAAVREVFSEAYAIMNGALPGGYQNAVSRLSPLMVQTDNLLAMYGSNVAAGLIRKLVDDVEKIHAEIEHYQESELAEWLDKIEEELPLYAQRMESMLKAALSEADYDAICDKLIAAGMQLLERGSLANYEGRPPLGWVIIATR